MEVKILQRAVVEVLNCIYECDFRGFSYGFRLGHAAHDALDALATGVLRKKVNRVLDADIRGFFDSIDHGWLVRFIEHRIADRRVLRLIQKWLSAGVLVRHTMRERLTAKLRDVRLELVVVCTHRSPIKVAGWGLCHVDTMRATACQPTSRRSMRSGRRLSNAGDGRFGGVVSVAASTGLACSGCPYAGFLKARIVHPWPEASFDVRTRGKSQVR
jgi:hypothetical protein